MNRVGSHWKEGEEDKTLEWICPDCHSSSFVESDMMEYNDDLSESCEMSCDNCGKWTEVFKGPWDGKCS